MFCNLCFKIFLTDFTYKLVTYAQIGSDLYTIYFCYFALIFRYKNKNSHNTLREFFYFLRIWS